MDHKTLKFEVILCDTTNFLQKINECKHTCMKNENENENESLYHLHPLKPLHPLNPLHLAPLATLAPFEPFEHFEHNENEKDNEMTLIKLTWRGNNEIFLI